MTRWTKRTLWIVTAIIAVQVITIGGVVALGLVAHEQSARAAEAESTAAAEAEERAAQAEAIEALRDQVLELGEVPVVSQPSPAPTSPPDPPRGKDGKDAPPPTGAQVYAAVVQCFTTSVCVAPKGDPGTPGIDGDDGLDAPAPTAEQLFTAVQQCFAAGVCVAPKGDQGDQGPVGAAGPTCPEGYTPMNVWLTVSDEELGIPRQQQAIVCLPTTPPSEGEPSS